ncbi:MAG TPA: ABC transporter substrate-binding protein [Thermomicrobiales bacterium]|jgi:iron complex transport system substrate-binding protein|nr:ABC transporter substrate-binding protein [Thermomicrobiales bacterium]
MATQYVASSRSRAYDRRRLVGTALSTALGFTVAGRSIAQTSGGVTPAASRGGWSFTDDRGMTVALPAAPRSVIAQTSSAAALWDYGYQVAGIYGPSRIVSGEIDVQTGNIDLDAVTVLGDFGEIDLEAVIALEAELYVDLDRGTGTLWYDPGSGAPEFDTLVQSVGFTAYEVSVLQPIDRFGELAAALGADPMAPDIVAAREEMDAALTDLATVTARKPELRVMAMAGDPATGTYVCNPAVIPDLFTYTEHGVGIVVPEEPDPAGGGNFENRSWEEIGRYPADVILVDSRSDLSVLEADGLWQNLPAVQAGQVGRWEGTFPLSPTGFGPVVRRLIELLERAQPLG